MLNILDRVCGWLLLLGAVLHGFGSLTAYGWLTPEVVWALSGSLAAGLLAAINLLRVGRPSDRALAWVSLAGCVGWFAIALGFGVAINAPLDPRALYHIVVTVLLALFSLRAVVRRS